MYASDSFRIIGAPLLMCPFSFGFFLSMCVCVCVSFSSVVFPLQLFVLCSFCSVVFPLRRPLCSRSCVFPLQCVMFCVVICLYVSYSCFCLCLSSFSVAATLCHPLLLATRCRPLHVPHFAVSNPLPLVLCRTVHFLEALGSTLPPSALRALSRFAALCTLPPFAFFLVPPYARCRPWRVAALCSLLPFALCRSVLPLVLCRPLPFVCANLCTLPPFARCRPLPFAAALCPLSASAPCRPPRCKAQVDLMYSQLR